MSERCEEVEILEAEPYIPRGIALRTINTWLRKIGLLLVVGAMLKPNKNATPTVFRTRFWLETL